MVVRQPLTPRRGQRAWERAANAQQRRLTRLYDTWAAGTKGLIRTAATRGMAANGLITLLESRLPVLQAAMQDAMRTAVLAAAAKVLGRDRPARQVPGVETAIARRIAQGELLVAESLIPGIRANIGERLLSGVAVERQLLDQAFGALRHRAAAYSGGYWVALFDVQRAIGQDRERERGLSGLPPERIRWVLDPLAEHCEDSPGRHGCVNLQGIYESWEALPTVPAGDVTCLGSCRCSLEVELEGQWVRGL